MSILNKGSCNVYSLSIPLQRHSYREWNIFFQYENIFATSMYFMWTYTMVCAKYCGVLGKSKLYKFEFQSIGTGYENFYICAYYTGVIFLKILLVHIRVRFTKHLFCPSIILKKQLSSSTEKHCLLPQNYISRDNQRNNDVNSFRYFNNHVYQSSVATRID